MHRIFASLLKQYPLLIFILLEFAAVSMVVSSNHYHKAAFSNGMTNMVGATYKLWNGVTEYFHLKKENERLARENARLYNSLKGSFRASDRKIFVWNDTIYRQQFQYVSAKVVSATINKRKNYLVIDKGRNQGIENDMGVIAPDGIVGMVKSVSPNYALIIPIINTDAYIAARLKKNDQKGIVSWDGKHFSTGIMKGIPGHIPLGKGDTIITSGQSIFFPEGLPVGYVAGYSKNRSDNFYTIRIQFAVDFNSIDYVYVIKNLLAEEQIELLGRIENEQ